MLPSPCQAGKQLLLGMGQCGRPRDRPVPHCGSARACRIRTNVEREGKYDGRHRTTIPAANVVWYGGNRRCGNPRGMWWRGERRHDACCRCRDGRSGGESLRLGTTCRRHCCHANRSRDCNESACARRFGSTRRHICPGWHDRTGSNHRRSGNGGHHRHDGVGNPRYGAEHRQNDLLGWPDLLR